VLGGEYLGGILQIVDMLKFRQEVEMCLAREERSQAFLARRLGHLPETFNKWLVGENRIPYEVVGQICKFFELDSQQQVLLFDLAGYPLPAWVNQSAGYSKDIVLLSSNEELWDYSLKSISQARNLVCDLTWGIDMPSFSQAEDDVYFAYVDAITEVCRKNVTYREVMTFNNDPLHFIWRAEKMLSQNLITYNLRYFDVDLKHIPPLLQCTIVDEEDLTVGLYRWPYLPIENEVRLIIRQPEVIRLFQDYFDTVWVAAQPIKEGDRIYKDVFDDIKRRTNE